MADPQRELFYRRINQLTAGVVAALGIFVLAVAIIVILLHGRITKAARELADLNQRIDHLERRLAQWRPPAGQRPLPTRPSKPAPLEPPPSEVRESPASRPGTATTRSSAAILKQLVQQLKELVDEGPGPDVVIRDPKAALTLLSKIDRSADQSRGLAPKDVRLVVRALLQLGAFREAAEWADRALQSDPRNAEAHFLAAVSRYRLGRYEQAVVSARKARMLDADYGWAWLVEAQALAGLGRADDALAAFTEAAKYRKVARDAVLATAQWLVDQKRPAEAVERIDASSLDLEGDVELWRLKGIALLAADQASAAAELLSRVSQRYPADYDARIWLGIAMTQLGRLPEAADHFIAAARLKPDDWQSHHWLGVVRIRQNKPELAIHSFDQALAAKADSAETWLYRGVAQANQGDVEQAIIDLQRAVKLDANRPDAYFALALLEAARGRLDPAAAHLKRAIELDPKYKDTAIESGQFSRYSDRPGWAKLLD